MSSKNLLAAVVLGLAAALGRPALAEDVTATTNQTMTDDQIAQWIRSAPAPEITDDQPQGVTSGATPRKVHGEVGFSVGTGGYRSGYAISTMPVGETGLLTLGIAQSRGPHGARFGGDWSSASLAASFGDGSVARCNGPTSWADQEDLPIDALRSGFAGRSRSCIPRP